LHHFLTAGDLRGRPDHVGGHREVAALRKALCRFGHDVTNTEATVNDQHGGVRAIARWQSCESCERDTVVLAGDWLRVHAGKW
jgi:hypothetical protein